MSVKTQEDRDEVEEIRVHVAGDVEINRKFDYKTLTGLPQYRRSCSFLCSTGERIEGVWRGVSLSDLMSSVNIKSHVTHLVFGSVDSHRVCIPVNDALEGILALEHVDSNQEDGNMVRFVAPNIEASRSVKDVRRIQAVRLGPDDERRKYENLVLDE